MCILFFVVRLRSGFTDGAWFAGSGGDLALAGRSVDIVGAANAEDLRAVIAANPTATETTAVESLSPDRVLAAGRRWRSARWACRGCAA